MPGKMFRPFTKKTAMSSPDRLRPFFRLSSMSGWLRNSKLLDPWLRSAELTLGVAIASLRRILIQTKSMKANRSVILYLAVAATVLFSLGENSLARTEEQTGDIQQE